MGHPRSFGREPVECSDDSVRHAGENHESKLTAVDPDVSDIRHAADCGIFRFSVVISAAVL